MADARGAELNSTGADANKRKPKIRFKAILPSEIPCETIESQVAENVSGNCVRNCRWNQLVGEFACCADFFARGKKNFQPWSASDARGGLAAEFELFEPLNGFALVGDDLCLPD
jgi:hypothetical protein